MPSWTKKEERQYEQIKRSARKRGRPIRRAKEIAARTVNKQRRERGVTPSARTQGTGNPSVSLEDRSLDEIKNIAAKMKIKGRSRMRKGELIGAIRAR